MRLYIVSWSLLQNMTHLLRTMNVHSTFNGNPTWWLHYNKGHVSDTNIRKLALRTMNIQNTFPVSLTRYPALDWSDRPPLSSGFNTNRITKNIRGVWINITRIWETCCPLLDHLCICKCIKQTRGTKLDYKRWRDTVQSQIQILYKDG